MALVVLLALTVEAEAIGAGPVVGDVDRLSVPLGRLAKASRDLAVAGGGRELDVNRILPAGLPLGLAMPELHPHVDLATSGVTADLRRVDSNVDALARAVAPVGQGSLTIGVGVNHVEVVIDLHPAVNGSDQRG